MPTPENKPVQPETAKKAVDDPASRPRPLNEQQAEEVKATTQASTRSQQSTIGAPTPAVNKPATTGQANIPGGEVASEAELKKALQHLSQIKERALTFAGKTGYNPHLYLKDKVTPLEQQLIAGGNSKQLVNSILALDPNVEPKI